MYPRKCILSLVWCKKLAARAVIYHCNHVCPMPFQSPIPNLCLHIQLHLPRWCPPLTATPTLGYPFLSPCSFHLILPSDSVLLLSTLCWEYHVHHQFIPILHSMIWFCCMVHVVPTSLHYIPSHMICSLQVFAFPVRSTSVSHVVDAFFLKWRGDVKPHAHLCMNLDKSFGLAFIWLPDYLITPIPVVFK